MDIAVNGWFMGQETAGSGQYIHHLLSNLPRQHDHVSLSVFIPANYNHHQWDQRWPNVAFVPVQLPRLPNSLTKLWWEQIAFPQAVRVDSADIAWVPYWAAPYWQPIPTVVTVHDVIPLLLPEYRGGLQHRAYSWLMARTAQSCQSVITVSHASADDIARQLHIPHERIHVIYHGPNYQTRRGPRANDNGDVRSRYNLPERFFLYLGGFDVRKNVKSIVYAYRQYMQTGGDPDIKLVIAGSLPMVETQFISDPRKTVAECGLETQVLFPGWIRDKDKPALYALATAFLFPSLYEGFGMMVLEAMAAGTPVITSNH